MFEKIICPGCNEEKVVIKESSFFKSFFCSKCNVKWLKIPKQEVWGFYKNGEVFNYMNLYADDLEKNEKVKNHEILFDCKGVKMRTDDSYWTLPFEGE